MPAREETRLVRFEIVPEDLAAFQMRLMRASPKLLRQKILGLAGLPLVVIAGWWWYVRTSEDPAATAQKLWWIMLLVPFHVAMFPRRWRGGLERLRERLVKDFQKSPLLGKRKVTVTEGEIREHNPVQEVAAPWDKVLRVERADERAFVYLSEKAAIIVPQRAFETPEAFVAFAEDLQEKWNRRRSASA